MPILTVRVIDFDSGKGIANVKVYLFEGGGTIEIPENATYSKATDIDGTAQFDISGFFRVGIIAKGYNAVQEDQTPPEEWKTIWTCWGAVGVARDIEYTFPVTKLAVPTGKRVLEATLYLMPLAGLLTVGIGEIRKRLK